MEIMLRKTKDKNCVGMVEGFGNPDCRDQNLLAFFVREPGLRPWSGIDTGLVDTKTNALPQRLSL